MALRDTLMILLSFYLLLRRSEVVKVKWTHLTFTNGKRVLLIPFTKTDQAGRG